jgi:hypothetical protein
LNVTHEQWRQVEPRLGVFRRDSQALCQQINTLRSQTIDLIAGSKPDQQAIAARQEEIRAGQQRMQQLVIGQLLAEKELLAAGSRLSPLLVTQHFSRGRLLRCSARSSALAILS